ncbi:MAG: hypothetical protein V4448_12020 [Pseudomonadota bacterium]
MAYALPTHIYVPDKKAIYAFENNWEQPKEDLLHLIMAVDLPKRPTAARLSTASRLYIILLQKSRSIYIVSVALSHRYEVY